MYEKPLKKILIIFLIAVVSLTALSVTSCEDHMVVNDDPGNTYPVTLIDTSVAIGSGRWILQDIEPGYYDVSINTDDAIEVKWMGGGVDSSYNTKAAVYEYIKQSVLVSEPVTLKIYNPTGIFFNPSAIVHLKIVKLH
jgi:hypothetical protein